MSELSSAFPVSGGLYFWSFMLAGKHGPFASWIVGWINLLGQVTHLYTCQMSYDTAKMLPYITWLATMLEAILFIALRALCVKQNTMQHT